VKDSRELWLERRTHYVTASDVAALLGENKHKTREKLMLEKRGLLAGFQGNEYTELASEFEEPLFKVARRRYGWALFANGLELHVDKECSRLAATPDAMMATPWGLAVVQTKWSTCQAQKDISPITKKGKPSEATYLNGPPLNYQLQVQAEMACTGAEHAVLLVMHTCPPKGLTLVPYYVPRHVGAISRIRREINLFWNEIEGL
jgi:predicted phage-related endonuclease